MRTERVRELWEARVSGRLVDVDANERPADPDQAYAIQSALTSVADSPVVGFKIGATAQAAMDLLGLDEPFFGPLYERYVYESGAEVPIVGDHQPALETEFVVGMASDVPPRKQAYSRAEVAESVAWICPGFEIIGTRFRSKLAGAGALLIADGGANMGFVQGQTSTDWQAFDLSSHPATLYVNGSQVASGHSGMSLFGHTLGAVAWLASYRAFAERGLKAGDIIMTGTCTGLTPIAPGDEARADFGVLGEVRARFVSL